MIDPNYYQNRYRINSIRLQSWDYSLPGMYFITICTKNRVPWFGHIKNSIMGLNIIGCIVNKYYLQIPNHYPNCRLDELIIMPNHIHGIIEINNEQGRDGVCQQNIEINNEQGRDGACPVSTKRHTLSNVVGSFKSICTNKIHKIGYNQFKWQSRFYEHIRDD